MEPTSREIESTKLYQTMGMTDEEYEMVKNILGRLPNYTEIGLFSVMWSEHCSYKNSKPLLRLFPTKGKRVLQGPGEGAGIVDIGDKQAVVFKLESHNHPSAVEPFDAAATGVGGIIRDVFSMGARPIASLNSLRFGSLKNPRVKFLFEEVVKGLAFYGKGVEVPTVGGEVYFDPCYEGNPLVNAMCVGILNHEDIKKGQAHGEGNIVMYVGAPTGRDGIQSATFASKELAEESEQEKLRIPAGDPYLEKRLIDACLEVVKHPALVGIQDMGAAGLISSSSEMASKAGMGIELDLDKVPQSEPDMTAYDMMLSETQERMLLVIKKGQEDVVREIFAKYDLEAVDVGVVTTDKYMRLFHKGQVVAEVLADALALQAPEYQKPSKEAEYFKKNQQIDAKIKPIENYNQTLLDLLNQPSIASKSWIYSQFECEEDKNIVVAPGSDAAVVQIEGKNKALALTTDCNGRYVYLNPYVGGQIAVAEAARNVIASGGTPIAITDNLNFGSPDNPEIFWQMEQAVKGISEACLAFETPVTGGNVSLNNERSGMAIYPTPTIGMVGLIDDMAHVTTSHFKAAGDLVYVIGKTFAEFGGSELQTMQLDGNVEGRPPAIDLTVEHANGMAVLKAIKAGLIKSAHDVSEGGLAVAITEALIPEKLGAKLEIELDSPELLFSESQSRYVLSVAPENRAAFEAMAPEAVYAGVTTNDGKLQINSTINISTEELAKSWESAIPCLLK